VSAAADSREPGAAWRVPVADVRLPDAARAAVADVIRSGWLSMGPRVAQFEDAFARYAGTEHALACSSATAALQLALAAAGVGEGDEVVMPSLTFVACANAARLAGARPVFADVVGSSDLTLDPEAAAAAIGPRTRAVVCMHYAGRPCATELAELCRERGVALIEDAAHAPGAATADGTRCGAVGTAGCFSFFANKNLPLGEGGMLTTGDAGVAAAARALRSHGMTSGTWERHAGGESSYDVERPGWNFRMDELHAALGLELLPLLDDWNERRARAVARYGELLDGVVELPFADRPSAERPAHHLMVVLLPEGTDRDAVAGALAADGVQTSVHYRPIHTFSAYAGSPAPARTDAVWRRLLTLPLFPHITDEQIELVVRSLSAALAPGLVRPAAS
jgi:dTDP-4-amino-4,6-dideoxygalactose transaminase